MNQRVEAALSVVITSCAVAVAASVVYQQVSSGQPEGVRGPVLVDDDDWDRLLHGGVRIGLPSAPVQIVEFGDFECPFCRTFHDAVVDVEEELPGRVSLVYYHYPLSIHRYSEGAAWAAECAAATGQFAEMARELFAKQDSLGVKSWTSYARSAGVVDTVGFRRCVEGEAPKAQIEAHRELANELSITSTPTVIINGWRYHVPPSADSLKRLARSVVVSPRASHDGIR